MGWTFYKSSTNSKVGPGKYLCNECDKSFRDNFDLKRHVDGVHLKLKPFKCNQCNRAFCDKWGLKYHVNGVHLNLKPKNDLSIHMNDSYSKSNHFKCNNCKIYFIKEKYLEQHISELHEIGKTSKWSKSSSKEPLVHLKNLGPIEN